MIFGSHYQMILQHNNNMVHNFSSIVKVVILLFLSLQTCNSHKGREITITLVSAFWINQNQKGENTPQSLALAKFQQLIKTNENMIIFGDQALLPIIKMHRNQSNTVFILKTLKEVKELSSSKMVASYLQNLQKTNPSVYSKYLKDLKMNSIDDALIMYSKILLLNQALSYDIFKTDYIYWIQPDIYSMEDYKKQKFFFKQHNLLRQFSLNLQLPFIIRSGNTNNLNMYQQKGSQYGNITTYATSQWFGGKVQTIATVASIYQNILQITLNNGDFWTMESVLTLMIHRYPKIITQINNLIPSGFYTFEINPFKERRIQQKRHILVSQGINSTLRFKQKNHPQRPIYKTEYRTNENFYEYQLLLIQAKFRAKRTEIFFSTIVLLYIAIKVAKFMFRNFKTKVMTVNLQSQMRSI